jgi:hypothetical protein
MRQPDCIVRGRLMPVRWAFWFLVLFGSMTHAQEVTKRCVGADARLIGVSAQVEQGVSPGGAPERIEVVSAPAAATSRGSAGKTVTLIAVGPVLGSMDSREVETELRCTAKGLVLTATITRSADYHGGVHKDVLWRPRIKIAVDPRRRNLIFQTIWAMRLTSGAELKHAQTPPYPDRKYPITITKIIR